MARTLVRVAPPGFAMINCSLGVSRHLPVDEPDKKDADLRNDAS